MPDPPLPPWRAARAGLALRRALLRAADALLPAYFVVWQASMGTGRTQLLAALAELGVADALGSGRATAAELAPRVGADPDALHRALRAAAAEGLVRRDRRGRFRLTRLGRALREEDPHSARAWVRYVGLDSTARAWGGLAEAIRTGRPAFSTVHGRVVWEHFAEHPEEERLFATAMRRVTEEGLVVTTPAYPWPDEGTVCDVAGGTGTLLAAVLAARPGLRGVLVEAPGVLAEAGPALARAGVRERVELVEGDLFGAWEARADLYLLKSILHDWGDAACLDILTRVRAIMPSGARLVLLELAPEPGDPHPFASWVDLQMLTQCEGGRERSVAELHALLRRAGLRPGPVRRTAADALLEASAP